MVFDPLLEWEHWRAEPLTSAERTVLNAVVSRQLLKNQDLSRESLLVLQPLEMHDILTDAAESLADKNLISIRIGHVGWEFHVSGLGLLKSQRGTDAESLALRYVNYFNNRVQMLNGEAPTITSDEIFEANVAMVDDYSLLRTVIAEFKLSLGGSSSDQKSTWGPPADLVTLSKVSSIRDLVARINGKALTRSAPRELRSTEQQKNDPQFGDWRIIDALSKGGQGLTYRVQNEKTYDLGVLKVLHRPDDIDNDRWEQACERQTREINTLRGLRHPLILRVLDSGKNDQGPWMVSKYHQDGSLDLLRDLLKGDAWRTLRLARDVAVALAVIHKKLIIHRDVKPKNIFLRSLDSAVLGDFGIVHVSDATELTRTAEIVAPKWFGPPEAEGGRLDDPQASFDVYSLGKVIYWCLSGGHQPWRERLLDRAESLEIRLDREDLRSADQLLAKMVLEDPAKRLQSMDEVVREIDVTIAALFGRSDGNACPICSGEEWKSVYLKADHLTIQASDQPGGAPAQVSTSQCKQCGYLRLSTASLSEADKIRGSRSGRAT